MGSVKETFISQIRYPPAIRLPQGGVKWTWQTGRPAHIYVFAYHPVRDESGDHRDASQWQFYVVAANRLPASQSISLEK
jgi:hypothetical protein